MGFLFKSSAASHEGSVLQIGLLRGLLVQRTYIGVTFWQRVSSQGSFQLKALQQGSFKAQGTGLCKGCVS